MLKCFKFVMDNPFHIRKAYRYVLRLQFSYGYIFLSRKLDYSIEINFGILFLGLIEDPSLLTSL